MFVEFAETAGVAATNTQLEIMSPPGSRTAWRRRRPPARPLVSHASASQIVDYRRSEPNRTSGTHGTGDQLSAGSLFTITVGR
jgi:hypothetical protein